MAGIFYETDEEKLRNYRYKVETRFNTFYCVRYEWQPQSHTLTLFDVREELIHSVDHQRIYKDYPHITILGGQIIIKPLNWEKRND